MQTGKGDLAYIRAFEDTDLESVVELANSSLTEYYSFDLLYDLSAQWRDGFLVYVFRDSTVAFLAGSKYTATEARVLLLAVTKSFRRMGIGKALMDDFMKRCRLLGLMSLRLEVRTSNKSAIDFYRKLGFVVISTLNHYYTDSSDAYVMWRML